jgi:hypothetical protein
MEVFGSQAGTTTTKPSKRPSPSLTFRPTLVIIMATSLSAPRHADVAPCSGAGHVECTEMRVIERRSCSTSSSRVAAAVLAIGLCTCGRKTTEPGSTEVTSATSDSGRAELRRVERERDDAREELTHKQEDILRLKVEVQLAKERDDLVEKAWATVDDAEERSRALKAEVAQAPTMKERQKLVRALGDLNDKRVVVERDARKLSTLRTPAWQRLRRSIEVSIEDLESAIRGYAE